MSVVLRVLSVPRLARYTGLFVGALLWLYITVESPLSGTSMNPACSFGSAFAAQNWMAIWVYFTAPPLGMLLAAAIDRHHTAPHDCATIYHDVRIPCLFCEYRAGQQRT